MTSLELAKPKPRVEHYHYSNEKSQGALLVETDDFPETIDLETHGIHSAYEDRISEWDQERYQATREIAGGPWMSARDLSDEELRGFAKVAFGMEEPPCHARIIHYYNVSSGYSCPLLEAVFQKRQAVEK